MIELKQQTESGWPLKAIFSPEKGMNLISFMIGPCELIDSSTQVDFEKRFAGLGPLIGPHFYRRHQDVIPAIKNPSLFPHLAYTSEDPFSHGIARYAPWKDIEYDETSFRGTLFGSDEWHGQSLASLEGQDFTLNFSGALKNNGLYLKLNVMSETDSIVGIHYYYRLPQKKGIVTFRTAKQGLLYGKPLNVDTLGTFSPQNTLTLNLAEGEGLDHTFFPYPNPLSGEILLETEEYLLKTQFQAPSEENSCQIWHPKDTSFVCIEPNSAQDPRHTNLTASQIDICLTPSYLG